MFNQDIRRIGFACKLMWPDQNLPPKQLVDIQSRYTEKTTTAAWMSRQTMAVAYDKMWELIRHNSDAARRLVEYVGRLPPGQRMLRLGSDQLPFYTLAPWNEFYRQADVRTFLERQYRIVGDTARAHDVRLSFHPGQFCCVVSENPDVVTRSIEELEYHTTLATWMGYGQNWQDFKINVHLSGRRGPAGFQAAYDRMSAELRNMLTIENDEFGASLDTVLEVSHLVPIVFDTHHNWINSGTFLTPTDSRFLQVIDSWRGIRPAIHYSVSRDEYIVGVSQETLPDMATLLQKTNKSKLRAHSDGFNHQASNLMALTFYPYADIMCEAKFKNLASQQLANFQESVNHGTT
jgi:UV DNA damage endonuclease